MQSVLFILLMQDWQPGVISMHSMDLQCLHSVNAENLKLKHMMNLKKSCDVKSRRMSYVMTHCHPGFHWPKLPGQRSGNK